MEQLSKEWKELSTNSLSILNRRYFRSHGSARTAWVTWTSPIFRAIFQILDSGSNSPGSKNLRPTQSRLTCIRKPMFVCFPARRCAVLALALLSWNIWPASAQEIELQPGELYIEYKPGDNGFHLWVANKPDIASILITDHTNDPSKKQHVYALRAASYNPYNGDEKRMLDGKFLPESLHSLIDSTPESNPYFPTGAFRVFIPFTVVYGYPWSRNGTKTIGRGSWLNIRTFEKAYASYAGSFRDNPFVLAMPEMPEKEEESVRESKPEVASVDEIREPILVKKENPAPSSAAASMLDNLDQKIDDLSRNTIDVALVLDTTISMRDNVDFLRSELIPLVKQKIMKFDSFRIGVVLYRDYGEEYLVKPFDFSSDLSTVQQVLDEITVKGGGDKSEAVYEGIYSALTDLNWYANKRLVIQVGDAQAHSRPKGKVTETMVMTKSREMLVQLQRINLSDIEGKHDEQSMAQDRRKLAMGKATSRRAKSAKFNPF